MAKVTSMHSQQHIREEARDWVIRFNRDSAPTKTDIAELKLWASQSPLHRAELHSAEQAWCDADLLAELAVPNSRPDKRLVLGWLDRLIKALTPTDTRGYIAAAMLLTLSVVATSWYTTMAGISGNGYYQTAIGEQRTLVLKDKSRIQMDTNSQLHIAYTDGKRQIRLQQGKAHFDVAKNPERPFQVYAAGGMVQAVGTAFSVFINHQDIKVTVDEGRVNLARIDGPVTVNSKQPAKQKPQAQGDIFVSLDRGQSALFNAHQETITELADNQLAQELAWRRGLLIFAGEPLNTVVAEVGRYTSTTIEIADPELRQLLIGGRFRTGELEALLDVLEAGFGVQISYVDKDHIQLRSAPE